MTIYNLGSINVDLFYQVPHLPKPGETLSARGVTEGLGGKGANMSVAAARAAARVCHIGAVGSDRVWPRDRLLEYGVDTRHIATLDGQTGTAVIAVDPEGENLILLNAGANARISDHAISAALSEAQTGDICVFQNETNGQRHAAETAKKMGLRVCYAAAPFEVSAVRDVLEYLDLLILNEIEAEQLQTGLGTSLDDLPVADVLVTLGAKGCRWLGAAGEKTFDALAVEAVDTTGAGDTFTGFWLAGLDRGMPMEQAIGQASIAAALMVTRHGTADVIPDLLEVQEFMQR
ncbi:ribokinase [Cognatishimia sp. MH4019]|uniref:ribokinase n=1 Tax=Cognatishimia sp. MH4019 TaxID=2854030 RepID=UPI001CD4B9AA|nr:ribokinase [Cognatishimia sp. MH4019]